MKQASFCFSLRSSGVFNFDITVIGIVVFALSFVVIERQVEMSFAGVKSSVYQRVVDFLHGEDVVFKPEEEHSALEIFDTLCRQMCLPKPLYFFGGNGGNRELITVMSQDDRALFQHLFAERWRGLSLILAAGDESFLEVSEPQRPGFFDEKGNDLLHILDASGLKTVLTAQLDGSQREEYLDYLREFWFEFEDSVFQAGSLLHSVQAVWNEENARHVFPSIRDPEGRRQYDLDRGVPPYFLDSHLSLDF